MESAINQNQEIISNNFQSLSSDKIPTKNIKFFSKKKLIITIFIILALLITFFISRLLLNGIKNKSESVSTNPNIIKLSSTEWKNVLVSAKKEMSINSITQVLSSSKLNNPLKEKTVGGVYSEVGNNFNLDTQPEDKNTQQSNVKGVSTEVVDSANLTSQEINYKQKKLHFGLKFEGMAKNDKGGNDEVNISVSYIGLQNLESNQSQSDLLVNGKWGDLILEDDGINPLHISTINLDKNKIAVNIEASDYLLVFLDRIFNPDKQRDENTILVDTNKIYPYLGNYVVVENENLISDEKIKNLIIKANTFKDTAFSETIGSFNNYIDDSTDKQLTKSSSTLGIVTVEINKNKFQETLNDYLNKIKKYYAENSEEYKQFCKDKTEECLTNLGYLSEENINEGTNLLKNLFIQYSLDKSGIIIDTTDFSFKGFALEINKNDKSLNPEQLLNIQKISFSFYLNKLENSNELFKPATTLTTNDLPKGSQYGSADEGNNLYTENKSYMRSLQVDLWQAVTSKSDQFCNIWWEPKFCLQDTNKWLIFNPNPKDYDQISLYYNLGSEVVDKPELSLKIHPVGGLEIMNCYYDEEKYGKDLIYPEYKDIVTDQGFKLRISSYGTKDGMFIGKVCMINGNNYTTELPFSGGIDIFGKNVSFNDSVEYFSDILKTIKIDGDIDPSWLNASLPDPKDYPERKQLIKYDGIQVTINNTLSEKGKSCSLSGDYYYAMDSYGIERNDKTTVYFPLKQAVCVGENTCIVCGEEGFDEVDILNCKGLRCNPQ